MADARALWHYLENLPRRRPRLLRAMLLAPVIVLLIVFFVVPLAQLFNLSLLPKAKPCSRRRRPFDR